MLLELQNNIIYGPVNSRRLGSSLGINILSPSRKVCTFNCLYCQYGWTDYQMMKGNIIYPDKEDILTELKSALINLKNKPSYITFSGNGEATLHPDFDSIVDGMIRIRDEFSPSSKTAILSNSTTVNRKNIRRSLSKLDVRIMKLDAGNNQAFQSYNRPYTGIQFDSIIDGLSKLDNIIIQALFTDGKKGNIDDSQLKDWIEKLFVIKPDFVQIYTLDRDYPSPDIEKVPQARLLSIKKLLKVALIESDVY